MSEPASRDSRSSFLRLRGLRFHLRRFGAADKPLLVYLHGWLDTTATFAPVAERLAERFHVAALDQRGYGYSEWPADGYWFPDYLADLDALLDALAPAAPITLVGHSMGSHIASTYAGIRPERIARLAVLDGIGLPDMPANLLPKRIDKWLKQLKAPARARSYVSFEELAARIRVQHPQLDEAKSLFIAQGWGHRDGDGSIRLLADPKHRLDMPMLYRSAESMEVWKLVQAPTLFIDGGRSQFLKMLPAEEHQRRRACFSNRQELVLENAGHMLHFDQPEALAEMLLQHL